MITRENFDKFVRLQAELSESETLIIDRITEIVQAIYKEFNRKSDTWYFPDAQEGEIGSLNKAIKYNETIELTMEPNIRAIVILNDGTEFDLSYEIPARWLFEDFQQELSEGKAKFIEMVEEKRRKEKEYISNKKKEKERLIAEAKAKLSDDEKKALGIK